MSFPKRLLSILAIPFLAVLFSIVVAKPANAAEFHFQDYTLAQDETVTDDLYITNSTTEINGLVQGDLMVIAGDIKITGTVTGDVYAIGSTVTFTGNTYGNLSIIGNDVSVQGMVKENAYTIGSSVTFSGNVEKDYSNIAMKTDITGSVGDDARFITSYGTIDSIIQGDLVIIGRQYDAQEDKVTGEVYDTARLQSFAQEQGIDLNNDSETIKKYTENWGDKLFGALFSFCSLSPVGYFIIAAAPVKTGKIISKITGSKRDFAISFGIGLGVLIIAPVVLFLLSVSLVGAPFALLILGVLVFLTVFGRIWVETAFGQQILFLFKKDEYRPFKSLAIGRLISVIIRLIPFVGFFYSVIIMSTAVGATLRMKLDYWNKGRKQ